MKPLICVLMALLFIATGCKHIEQKPDLCLNHESVLCDIQRDRGVSLNEMSIYLKGGNLSGLSMNKYQAKDAYNFIEGLEADLNVVEQSGGNYGLFLGKTISRFSKLPAGVRALFVLFEQEMDIPEMAGMELTPYDFYLLRKHLTEQKMLTAVFIE